jgi:hypothetical protein
MDQEEEKDTGYKERQRAKKERKIGRERKR